MPGLPPDAPAKHKAPAIEAMPKEQKPLSRTRGLIGHVLRGKQPPPGSTKAKAAAKRAAAKPDAGKGAGGRLGRGGGRGVWGALAQSYKRGGGVHGDGAGAAEREQQ